MYEGSVSVTAEGLKPTVVPLRVSVSDWTVSAPEDFFVKNFLYLSEDAMARYYEVPLWSDKHLAQMGQALALMAEANSRQVFANLAIDFHGDGAQRGVARPVDQAAGWQLQARLHRVRQVYGHCREGHRQTAVVAAELLGAAGGATGQGARCATKVSSLDPATGKLGSIPQPPYGTAENLAFWQPVFAEIFKKLKARGWLEVTTLGYNSQNVPPPPEMVDVASKLWPDGTWSFTSHFGKKGMGLQRHGQ